MLFRNTRINERNYSTPIFTFKKIAVTRANHQSYFTANDDLNHVTRNSDKIYGSLNNSQPLEELK